MEQLGHKMTDDNWRQRLQKNISALRLIFSPLHC